MSGWDVAISEAELASARADAEARMGADNNASTVVVMRKAGLAAQDETTGLEAVAWATVHPELPARFPPPRGGAANSRNVNIGGVDLTLGVREVHVPYETEDLADGDLVVVTAGRAVGAVWQIIDASPPPDQATAYRLDTVAVDQPTEWA